MAKGKGGSGRHYVSKGKVGIRTIHTNTSEVQKHLDKLEAFAKGKRVMFTITNPDKNARNKPFIRVLGSDLYGDWRHFKAGTIEEDKPKKKASSKSE